MVTNKRDSTSTGLLGKIASAGKTALKAGAVAGALLMPYSATSNKANADIIQVANQTNDSNFTSYSGVIRPDGTSGATIGYDSDIDTLLSTHDSTEFATVIYSDLNGNIVDQNVAPQPTLADSYTMKLSFRDNGHLGPGITNYLTLTDFDLDNSNGITDYRYALSVDTGDSTYTNSGLVSEVLASADKKFGTWTQEFLPTGNPNNTNWNAKSYGQITFTPVGIPEPSTIALLAGAGLVAGAGYVASQLGKAKKK